MYIHVYEKVSFAIKLVHIFVSLTVAQPASGVSSRPPLLVVPIDMLGSLHASSQWPLCFFTAVAASVEQPP